MGAVGSFVAWVGRFLISILFIVSGIHQLLDWQASEQILVKLFTDWGAICIHDPLWSSFFASAFTWSTIVVSGAIFFQLIGGLCLLLGIQVRFGAFLLAVVLIPVTVLFYPFWMAVEPAKEVQMMAFMRNVAILGGLLLVMAYGKGSKKGSMRRPQTDASESR